MDDPTLTAADGDAPEPRRGEPRRGLGPAASAGLLGLLAGLAIGWVAWREAPGPTATPATTPATGVTLVEGVDVSHDPVLGPDDAPITIVEFSDFECPYCARFARQTAPALRRQYGDDLRWIFVNNPLNAIHPRAHDLALAGECAHEQGAFWAWYDEIFSGRHGFDDAGIAAAARSIDLDDEAFDSCFHEAHHAAEVAADLKEAQKFYILGTPTFFVNGRRLEGALPPETFASVIDSILRR